MGADVFKPTQLTWLDGELQRGRLGRLNINRHVMETYARPLTVYFLGTNLRWLGEPEEIINGFFASRLAQDDFFLKWRASGMRLRRWLMNALCYHLMEVRKARRSSAAGSGGRGDDMGAGMGGAAAEDAVTFSGDPHAAVDRAATISFVQQAMNDARRTCAHKNMATHWDVFLRHHVDGRSFLDIARELGVDEARAAVMSRSAERNFKAALAAVLVKDGVADEDVNAEINLLLEASGS